MIDKAPTSRRRTIAMAAAVTLASAGMLAPALVANAATIFPKQVLVVNDLPGYKDDSFTVPNTPGLIWQYLYRGTWIDLVPGQVVKPNAHLETPPEPTDLALYVWVDPGEMNGFEGLPIGEFQNLDVDFTNKPATQPPATGESGSGKFVAPKAPSMKVSKSQGKETLALRR